MKLQSVKETAERFHISERRVQKLCESGRIEGAQRISNAWIIPSTAQKPVDERMDAGDEDLLSLTDLCKELSISEATGRNWVRLGKLIPTLETKRTLFFSREYAAEIRAQIKSGENNVLKSRRNKKYISGTKLYHSYISPDSINLSVVRDLVTYIEEKKIEVADEIRCALIAECAIQFMMQKENGIMTTRGLTDYIQGKLSPNRYLFLVDDFLRKYPGLPDALHRYPELFAYKYTYEENEDILGFLYISLKNIGNRKSRGVYFTPTVVVEKLCQRLFDGNDIAGKNVLDPCCGTGNFILQLPSEISYDKVYGNDLDSVSVKIARINYALKYGISDADVIYAHISEGDYLSYDKSRKYDFIIGNPPWGYEFSDSQKENLRSKYKSAIGTNIESYDVFVEQALMNLRLGGLLSFVLPEAILNVKAHTAIRQIMLDNCSFQYLEFLGNVFDGVQCPGIILQAVYTGGKTDSTGMIVRDRLREYTIHRKRKMDAACLSFTMTDSEYFVLEKIEHIQNKVTLAQKAEFALGIVTGNNKEFISCKKNEEQERILKGSDISRYRIKETDNYIVFRPEAFQQTAPTQYYRAAEKLLYRFVCDQLVFAYDDKQTLSLNSCNILIPKIDGLHIKYILAILNARAAQFYFKKQFHSVKVLRSHIESIPIPFVEKEVQEGIVTMVDAILSCKVDETIQKMYDDLDREIAELYGMNDEDYQIVRVSMEGENLFLN